MKTSATRRNRTLIPTLGAAVAVAAQISGCGEVRYRDATVAASTIERIQFRGDVGVVDLVPAKIAKVEYAVRAPDGAASVTPVERDGVLEVRAKCHTPVLCAVDAQIFVPEGVTVEIDLGMGEVWSTGLGNLNISVGQGDVDVDTTGTVTVQVGQGTARINTTGSESVRVAVGDGDIVVRASPDNWNMNVTAQEESVSGIVHDPTAVGQLELVAPAGSVVVRPGLLTQDSGTP
jgi:hypothetical protein